MKLYLETMSDIVGIFSRLAIMNSTRIPLCDFIRKFVEGSAADENHLSFGQIWYL